MACWCLQLSPNIHLWAALGLCRPELIIVGFDAAISISLSMSLDGASADDVTAAAQAAKAAREKSEKVERENRRVSSTRRGEDLRRRLGRGDGGGGGVEGKLFKLWRL